MYFRLVCFVALLDLRASNTLSHQGFLLAAHRGFKVVLLLLMLLVRLAFLIILAFCLVSDVDYFYSEV